MFARPAQIATSALAILVLLTIAPRSSEAGLYQTGNMLLDECKDEGSSQMFCMGFVAGVADLAQGLQYTKILTNQVICIEPAVTQGQLRLVVIKYLDAHPAELHYPANSLVFSALREAFPCSEASP